GIGLDVLAGVSGLLSRRRRHGVDRNVGLAILGRRKAHLHKPLCPTTDSLVDLPTKTAVPDFRAVASNNLSVEPGRAVAGNLPVEADDRERPYPQPVTALAEVIGLPTLDDVLRDLPIIGIDPFDMTSPAQRLQATDMGAHISLGVLALAFEVVMDMLQVPARPVDAIAVGRVGSDVAVGRSWTRANRSGFNDDVPPHLFDPVRVLELDVMNAAIDAVDDQIDPLAHLVSGQALGQDAADDLLA